MITVRLEWYEIKVADFVGMERLNESIKQGLKDKLNDPSPMSNKIGARGEQAVSKGYDIHWDNSINAFKAPDLGKNIQVRTRTKDWHDLTLRKGDNPEHIYVLVIARNPEYDIMGWRYGHEVMVPENLKTIKYRDKNGVEKDVELWFKKQSELYSAESLLEIIRK